MKLFQTTTLLTYNRISLYKYDTFIMNNDEVLPDNWYAMTLDEKYDYLNNNGYWKEGWFDDEIDSPLIDDDERGLHTEECVSITSEGFL